MKATDRLHHLVNAPTATTADVQRVVALAKRLGLKMVLTKSINTRQAENKRFQVTSGNEPQEVVSDACHEIGHYLAAPPDLRDLPNYGLGPSPDDGHLEPARFAPTAETIAMEAQASMLGLCIERSLGVSALSTLLVHCWVPYPSGYNEGSNIVVSCSLQQDVVLDARELADIGKNIALLQERGLLDQNLHPVYPDVQ